MRGCNQGGGHENVDSVSFSTVAWDFQLTASLWFGLPGVWMLRPGPPGHLHPKAKQGVYGEGAVEVVSYRDTKNSIVTGGRFP